MRFDIRSVVISSVVLAAVRAEAQVSRRVTYTKAAFGATVADSTLTLEDEPGHRLWQFFRIDKGEMSHQDFAIDRELIYGQGDHRSNRTRVWGYSTYVLSSGDRIYLSWEGSPTDPSSRQGDNPIKESGTVMVLSGTGKFKTIRGKGTYRVFTKGPVIEENILEVTY